jgi:hypothetical protein
VQNPGGEVQKQTEAIRGALELDGESLQLGFKATQMTFARGLLLTLRHYCLSRTAMPSPGLRPGGAALRPAGGLRREREGMGWADAGSGKGRLIFLYIVLLILLALWPGMALLLPNTMK